MTIKTVTITNIGVYKSIVDNHYKNYLKSANIYDTLLSKSSPENLEDELYRIQSVMDEDAAVILVFGQMTIEAFCNAYLLQRYSKTYFENKPFIDKVNLMIVSMLDNIGISISEKDAHNYYGADIPAMISIRKKCVHRYPVCAEFDLDSEAEFEKASVVTAEQIENTYLRRIKRSDVKNAATAYRLLLKKLEVTGVDFSTIGFSH